MACLLSEITSRQKEFHNQLPNWPWPRGEEEPKSNVPSTSRGGRSFLLKGKLITFGPLVINVIYFFTDLYEKALTYSASNTAGSALSAYVVLDDGSSVGPNPGGGTPRKFGWGCAARRWKPLPYFRPKYVISPTLFQTWPKIPYPISDQTLTLFRLVKHSRTSLNSRR